ncbi:DNA helicase MCM8, partial [Tetrabaena socialis]
MAAVVRSAMPAAWPDFFPPSEFAADDRRALLIADLLAFFLTETGPIRATGLERGPGGAGSGGGGGGAGEGGGRGQAFVEALRPEGPGSYSLQVDFGALEAASGLADLPAALEGSPVEALGCIAVAAHQAAFAHRKGRLLHAGAASGPSSEPPRPLPPGRIAIRLVNHAASQTHIRQLKSSSIGKLVTLRGTVVRMTPVRPLVTHMVFICAKCGSRTELGFADGLYAVPTKCAGNGCRSRTFTPHRSSARCIDSQKIRLQELLGADKAAEGQVPRSVEVELSGDLVHSCVVGDVVAVVGVVKVMATGDDLGKFSATGSAGGGGGPGGGGGSGGGRGGGGGGRGGGSGRGSGGSSLFLLYLEGVSVSGTRQQLPGSEMRAPALGDSGGPYGCSDPSALPSFISKDLAFVVKFCESYGGDQLRQLVHALCPPIYGNELVKMGLVLALLGGVRKHCGPGADNGSEGSNGGHHGAGAASGAAPGPGSGSGSGSGRVPVRGDIHVLLVGDPGLGKSQLLQAAVAAAPRGIYVCGSTSTSAGLTVSVVRDGVSGESVLEAGAVVLADRGVCAVDEFDRMASEHQALLEVMEQQEVSVAKAGLVANLPARASILAAANPAGGSYNRAKSLAENIKLSPAMLSRFDLIFVLLDRPDEALDGALSEHVMALHSGLADRAHAARQRLIEYGTSAPRLLTAGPTGGGGASQATQAGYTQAGER